MTQDAADLTTHLGRFKGRRLVCIGDVMVDRFIYGDVRRISPEAPVPVVRITNESSQLGGAGNVARNASALGVSVAFFSVIGSDRAGREVTGLLSELETIEPFLRVNADRETTIKNRFFSTNGHHLLRADRETATPLTAADEADLAKALTREIASADAVLLSDYGKGVVTESFARIAIDAAKEAGKPVVVDPKGTDFTLYSGATVVTPNRAELALAAGQAVETDDDLVAAAQALLASANLGAVLVTRSAEGMTLVQKDGQVDHLNAESHEVADVTGAGDTVVATLGTALAGGVGLLDSARLANAAAGLVVRRRGTAVVSARELAAALLRRDLTAAEAKVTDATTASARASLWRSEGNVIGFTNGCFDLLHPGHVSLLGQAKSACDKLIVGLNSDVSVGRLKGPGRPVQSETSRATVLASMESVDLVVVFAEDTPLELIETLRPDILVKGADYAKTDIVGADIVEAYGGKIIRADLVDSVSTTATIASLKEG
ncbi:MAG: D-glycero-beta-D-manno-heptose-7-phosphate kinase [Rhodospirillaceae bacterium]|jgi:D-beta-D-heptose 7-phosphate kinase / D-beta-D-heptose 1-phosphate adenosyltransferase|nr:D-glycero-beta-D-manno-heptose-7-phosphate kinase [Rhodospirillaceae bacterium]MBT5566501.1 D-glycero-beta-D-manno-heptose-7-phosphate kinase [Rhodospirillaceae bacterium]MBT6089673.1 D-glycero-beta-D-manno-heptose-7-phosphate kinase [Rhodospirillaceae bacterium]MBT7450769.1 D-glycero-beta-D-manno-heptose-7-phosphate kinase [Rhodospirillaceae bacterium]